MFPFLQYKFAATGVCHAKKFWFDLLISFIAMNHSLGLCKCIGLYILLAAMECLIIESVSILGGNISEQPAPIAIQPQPASG